MVEINELSKIGIGTYHMSILDGKQKKAFETAIEYGCNLIDTASNYEYGNSENLIGTFIKEHPKKNIFIISKAGYISTNSDKRFIKSLISKGMDEKEITSYNDVLQCINPDFIVHNIKQSLGRLNRKFVDGYLIHNPEYFLYAHPEAVNDYYSRIKNIFEVLEDLVEKKIIRYYGISSNTLCFSKENPFATNILKLLKIATEVYQGNHFKLAQFPYNLIENSAKIKIFDGSDNLISILKNNNIISIANRPLNAKNDSGFVRLAYIEGKSTKEFEINAKNCLEELKKTIQTILKYNFNADNIMEFEPIVQFIETWQSAGNHKSAKLLYNNILHPFINFICRDNKEYILMVNRVIKKAYRYSLAFADMNMRMNTQKFIHANFDNRFKYNKKLAPNICKSYLDDGIDHILVGLTKKKYVENFKSLLSKNTFCTR